MVRLRNRGTVIGWSENRTDNNAFLNNIAYWSQSGFCRTGSLLMGASSLHHFHPASLPVLGQRRPSPELSSGDASPAHPGGTRNSALPWLNEPGPFVSYEIPHLHPDAHAGCTRREIKQKVGRQTTNSICEHLIVTL